MIGVPLGHGGAIRLFRPTTVPEFIAYAKANPGKINMASSAMVLRRTSPANCSK